MIVLVLAGCTATGGQPAEVTVTPAPVPTDPPPTPAYRLAPGLSEAGVVGPLTLVAAHARLLRSSTYHVRIAERRERLDGTRIRSRSFEGTFANRTSYRLRIVEGRDNETVLARELYADGDALYERLEADGTVRYYVPRDYLSLQAPYPLDPLGDPTQNEELYVVLTGAEPAYVGSTRVGEETRYRLAATRAAKPSFLAAWDYVDRVSDYELEATVTDRGLVRAYRVTYVATGAGERWRVVRTARWTDVGNATVTAPDWYATARARS